MNFILRFSILLSSFLIVNTSVAQYKISQIVDENKINIPAPYKYDGFLMNEFSIDLINKNIALEFVAFKNQKYKLLFCSSAFDEPVLISIYDKKNPSVKVGEATINATNRTWTFDPPKNGSYSIVYEIPPSETDVEHKACLVMLIAFSDK